ncbi:hypothetical protein llap_22066 [Limosa lapponica baueri]|uniref:Uncharacterized protein n=1 Tax=Limosa lapponica baueri TaxID=1758121 RepID=A0A2I0T1F3_LIMLA|nr:hypothetical protein llap_22066 [Limosa lapponica baueri]
MEMGVSLSRDSGRPQSKAECPSLPIVLHLTPEVHIPTPSQDPILLPSRNPHHVQEEAKRRVVTVILGQGHLVITTQGHGHPRTGDAIHGQDLQYLEASLPLNGLYVKGMEKGSILRDTEKFCHMI